VKALPIMAKKAADPQLKQGFLTHLEEPGRRGASPPCCRQTARRS
jgi:hypothetical protein